MSTQPKAFLTPEQYLATERQAEFRSEYWNGEMFAMSGATREHNLVNGNAFRIVSGQLLERPCESYFHDMRVRISSTGLYTYPDLVVVCEKPLLLDGHFDTLLNPALILEVLSPSTEAYDRGRKFEHYQKIDSLQEYVLVASDRVHVDYFRRSAGGWLLTSASTLDDTVGLSGIGCTLPLRELYRKVEFNSGANR